MAKGNAKVESKVVPKKVEKKVVKKSAGRAGKINYFTVQEDNTILEYFKKNSDKTKTEISKDLANKLNRPVEGVRDRIKRYISKLSPADQATITKESKKNGTQYVFFKKSIDGTRKIEKISSDKPILQNRDIQRRPRKSAAKKPKAKKQETKSFEEKTKWIVQKL